MALLVAAMAWQHRWWIVVALVVSYALAGISQIQTRNEIRK
jgi:hypothetical protein